MKKIKKNVHRSIGTYDEDDRYIYVYIYMYIYNIVYVASNPRLEMLDDCIN